MFLIVDAGNTNIKLGFFDKGKLTKKLIIPKEKFVDKKLPKIKDKYINICIGSVIPSMDQVISDKLYKTYNVKPRMIQNKEFEKEFDLEEYDLDEIGTDILGTALFLKKKFKKATGVCFGTATFSVAVKNRKICGVTIIPWPYKMLECLNLETEKIKNQKMDPRLYDFFDYGKTTETAIAAGANHLTLGYVFSLILTSSEEYKIKKMCVLGGHAKQLKFFRRAENIYIEYDPVLYGYYYLAKLWTN